jgi:amino acid permease
MASQSHDFSHEFNDGEKGTVNPEKNVGGAKLPSFDVARSGSRTGSVAVELEDDRYLQTQRGLKSRHAQMIAIGGTIGTGLFVGSGQTLARGGPAFILASFCIMTALVLFVVTAITEIAAYLPVHGGTMSYYGYRYVSRSLGFAMGYLLVWPLSFPEAPWILMIVQILVFSRYSGSI